MGLTQRGRLHERDTVGWWCNNCLNSQSAQLMLPILAYRIQEKAYGGLSPTANARSQLIATPLRPQSRSRDEARQRFKSGTKLVREWRGKTHEVTLNDEGYHYLGKTYKSLSPIACEITGTRWSGPAFFGTKKVKTS
jgi:hypothetical protein